MEVCSEISLFTREMHIHHNDNDGWELYRIFVAISDCTCKSVHQLNQWLYRYNEDITVYVFVTLINQRYLRLIVIRYFATQFFRFILDIYHYSDTM